MPNLDHTTTWLRPEKERPSVLTPTERGARIGRYLVIERIGQGGIGVIYSAYDPDLDRKVALKLLQRPSARSGDSDGHRRLVREARALARLAHPNVVSVHDVGNVDDQVFVAMEFIRGRTLAEWLARDKPGWRRVLDVFRQAGEGLAVAHRAGLLHRDFKPTNVMLGDDGRVRVLDFGLARHVAREGDELGPVGRPADLHHAIPADEAFSMTLTRTGTRMGTPAYMAPEQIQGLETDARTDQFSFCAALHEALFDELPFRGDNWEDFSGRVCRGELSEVTSQRGVPTWLRKVLLRGLNPQPAARYPSMRHLLDALDRHPQRRKKWAAALAVGAITLSLLFAWQTRTSSLCQGVEEKLAGVWDDSRRGRLKTDFLATQLPYATQAWSSSQRILDNYAREWSDMYIDTCEATHKRGEQSEALLDLRMQCLAGRLRDLEATVNLLLDADSSRVRHAVRAVSRLRPLSACADFDRLQYLVSPPEDESSRLEVEQLRQEVAQVRALREAGQHRDALPWACQLADASLVTGYEPLMAETHHILGRALRDNSDFPAAAQTLAQAGSWALQGRHDEIRGRILLDLVWVLGDRLRRTVEGERWLILAHGAVRRGAGLGDLKSADEADWHQAAVVLYLARRDMDRALSEARAAVQIRRNSLGPDDGETAVVLSTLVRVLYHRREFEEALLIAREVEGLQQRRLGIEHPETLLMAQTIGEILNRLGRYPEAVVLLDRALESSSFSFGPESAEVATVLTSLGNTYWRMKRFEEARARHSRALEIRRRIFGPRHARVAESLQNLAMALRDLGRGRQAEALLAQAVEVRREVDGPDHPLTLSTQKALDKLRGGGNSER